MQLKCFTCTPIHYLTEYEKDVIKQRDVIKVVITAVSRTFLRGTPPSYSERGEVKDTMALVGRFSTAALLCAKKSVVLLSLALHHQ